MNAECNTARRDAVVVWMRNNPEPVDELCPELVQYWRKSDGTYVTWSSRTKQREEMIHGFSPWGRQCDTHSHSLSVMRDYWGFYVRYIEELNALEIARVYRKGGRGVDGDTRRWHYNSPYDRYVIFRDDPTAYGPRYAYRDGKYYSKCLDAMIRKANHDVCDVVSHEEFKKWSRGIELTHRYGGGALIWPFEYAEWIRKNLVRRNVSERADRYDNVDLGPLPDIRMNSPVDYRESEKRIVYYERIDDNLSVLRRIRPYRYNYAASNYIYDPQEDLRIFITEAGHPTSMVPDCGGWQIVSNLGYRGGKSMVWYNSDAAMECKPLKYIMPILPETQSAANILTILRHPIIEQLSKAGYPGLAKELACDNQVAANLKKYFSVEKETKTPMYKLLGVNKHILTQVENAYNDRMRFNRLRTIKHLKEFCGRFDVSDLSKESVKIIMKGLMSNTSVRLSAYLPSYSEWSWNRYELSDEDRAHLMMLFRKNANDSRILPLFLDTARTWRQIDRQPDIDLFSFRGYDDLLRRHNSLVEILNTQRAEARARHDQQYAEQRKNLLETFKKLQPDRIKRYEYENDEFAVRVPKSTDEIREEGSLLHHCVAGYADSHAKGTTNILFLRRRSDEQTPFYTIEIRDNRVVQIHGKYNRWLGNDPDAVPFMYQYLKQLGVHFDAMLLLNKGSGYSAGTESLPQSALLGA